MPARTREDRRSPLTLGRFVWAGVREPREGGADEAYEALQWLGRRLAFEAWFEDVRSANPATEAESA